MNHQEGSWHARAIGSSHNLVLFLNRLGVHRQHHIFMFMYDRYATRMGVTLGS